MRCLNRPLVLVHGLWNTPKLFNRLRRRLDQPESLLFTPHLPDNLGRKKIGELAVELDSKIKNKFGSDVVIDLLGFSMGGLISRVWLQDFKGYMRVRRFFSVGSPHKGTLTAQIVPYYLFPGIAEMKFGSQLIKSLETDSLKLENIECRSYFCRSDLMSFPGFMSVLPTGITCPVPVLNHKALIKHSNGIDLLARDLLEVSLTKEK